MSRPLALTTHNSTVKDLVNVTVHGYFTIRHVATLQKQLLSHTVSLETVSAVPHLVTAVSLSINQAPSKVASNCRPLDQLQQAIVCPLTDEFTPEFRL